LCNFPCLITQELHKEFGSSAVLAMVAERGAADFVGPPPKNGADKTRSTCDGRRATSADFHHQLTTDRSSGATFASFREGGEVDRYKTGFNKLTPELLDGL
jgi:hypothetical protein